MELEPVVLLVYVVIMWLNVAVTTTDFSLDGIFSAGWTFALFGLPMLIIWVITRVFSGMKNKEEKVEWK